MPDPIPGGVVIVAIGTPGAALARALERFAARGALVLSDSAPAAALPARVLLAWIFVDAPELPAPAVAAWHARLAALAPVQLALRADAGQPDALARACADLAGGVILQPYDDATLAQVCALVEGVLARP